MDSGSAETERAATATRSLVPSIRTSLNAKLERLLMRPLIARIAVVETPSGESMAADVGDDVPDIFGFLRAEAQSSAPPAIRRRPTAWRDDPHDGTTTVCVAIDYDDVWQECEKEVGETVANTVDSKIVFLTPEQKTLFENSPREFLALRPGPARAELVSYRKVLVGGTDRVVELVVAEAPESRTHLQFLTIIPNLFQIEKQLEALAILERAADDGPLAPLRVLLGLAAVGCLQSGVFPDSGEMRLIKGLDEFQAGCIHRAMQTPHFAVIKGPPGSGKTTVITNVIQLSLARGEQVLVVSPTHVAVDNVVEKLIPKPNMADADRLEDQSLPLRYAARPKKLSERAMKYWVGPKKQMRAATLSVRIQRALTAAVPFAGNLYALEDDDGSGYAPLSAAIAGVHSVICGTPIGILSCGPVKESEPGHFDLLIVDEVSKMTLPEFLAIAIKAKRWVLVGDPDQLPPFNNAEENGATLDDIIAPTLELACSVAALLESAKPGNRPSERGIVVTSAPERTLGVILAQLADAGLENLPDIGLIGDADHVGIVVCAPGDIPTAQEILSQQRGHDRQHNPDQVGTVPLLVQRGLRLPRPAVASGTPQVKPAHRAQARIFETAFDVYHAHPWSDRAGQKLKSVSFRHGLNRFLPTVRAIEALAAAPEGADFGEAVHAALIAAITERFAVNTISVYDWLTGISAGCFDTAPLVTLAGLPFPDVALREAVRPFVGTLKKQYRMHSSLSRVPRDLFYFREALFDGKADTTGGCRVVFRQVSPDADVVEANPAEAAAICKLVSQLNCKGPTQQSRPNLLVITPYREHERLLNLEIGKLRATEGLEHVDVEVCTLDRCQGREAEYVFISLVRNRSSAFMDNPKRWNVALTRAMEGLFIFGDIAAYLDEARRARRQARGGPLSNPIGPDGSSRVMMSLLARILETYERQIAAQQQQNRPGVSR